MINIHYARISDAVHSLQRSLGFIAFHMKCSITCRQSGRRSAWSSYQGAFW